MKTYFCQDWSREGGVDSCYEVTRMSLIEERENRSCCVDPPQVGDLKIVDRVLFTKMTVVQDFKKMEAMWGSGAEQPEVKKMWMEKVPHKGGEHKGPQQEGSHDNVVAGDPASHSGGRRCRGWSQ